MTKRARVVVDISNLKKYNIEKTSNNTVVINVETKAAAPTPKPTVNNGNSNNNSTITADSSKLILLEQVMEEVTQARLVILTVMWYLKRI
mgnify:CR=1 FL=1